jgi:hypothetical protein
MLFNQISEGRFSAIAASFNPALKWDCAKARSPLAPYMDAHFFAKRSIHNFENR